MFGVFLCTAPACVLAAWGTTQFEVFLGEPWKSNTPNLVDAQRGLEYLGYERDEPTERPAHIPQSTVEEIERYLGEVARRYSGMGFPEPMLEPIVKRDDGTFAYRVFLYDGDLTVPAVYSTDCEGGALRRTIRIDVQNRGFPAMQTIDASGQVTPKGYQDLAHELFHAVQARYPLFLGNCEIGDWILEGTAQAMGVDMARELRGVDFPGETSRWGLRRYGVPLRIADDAPGELEDDAYGTASFWRYLGEQTALDGGIPGPGFVAPDYRYLDDFFQTALPAGVSEKSELQWLDANLKKNERLLTRLNRAYPYFASTFAAYANHRLVPSAAMAGVAARNRWLGAAFGECPLMLSNVGEPPARTRVKLERVASGCFLVASDIAAPVAVQVTARGAPGRQLAALAVGTHDGAAVGKPVIVTVAGEDVAFWLFRVNNVPGEQTTFVVSNVAEAAQDTEPVAFDLEVTVNGWATDMGAP